MPSSPSLSRLHEIRRQAGRQAGRQANVSTQAGRQAGTYKHAGRQTGAGVGPAEAGPQVGRPPTAQRSAAVGRCRRVARECRCGARPASWEAQQTTAAGRRRLAHWSGSCTARPNKHQYGRPAGWLPLAGWKKSSLVGVEVDLGCLALHRQVVAELALEPLGALRAGVSGERACGTGRTSFPGRAGGPWRARGRGIVPPSAVLCSL